MPEPRLELSKPVADEVRKTDLLYVRLPVRHRRPSQRRQDPLHRRQPRSPGQPRRALCQGLGRDHAALCPGQAAAPLLRTGPRGSGQFRRSPGTRRSVSRPIGWARSARSDPGSSPSSPAATSRQSLTGYWAQQFGTPNYAAHGGFCSVNMAAAGIMTIGGAFWEFGAPDWERTKLFVLFGVAEDHDSNPIKIGIAKLKARGARFVSVNPVRTGYSAVADNWIGIRPGTDGLLILSLVHELLKARQIDVDYLIRYSNAAWLVIDAPGTAEHGLFAREDGKPLIYDSRAGAVAAAAPGAQAVALGSLPARRRTECGSVIRASCRTLSRFRLFARTGFGPHGRACRNHPRLGSRDRPGGVRRGDHGRGALDRHARRAPPALHRPAGLLSCHARHLGPFQRLPDGTRAASPAGADRRGRLPGRLPLRAALPEAGRGPSDPARPRRAFRLQQAAVGAASRLSARPGGPADRSGRPPEPHRQGIFLGCAARRPWR